MSLGYGRDSKPIRTLVFNLYCITTLSKIGEDSAWGVEGQTDQERVMEKNLEEDFFTLQYHNNI